MGEEEVCVGGGSVCGRRECVGGGVCGRRELWGVCVGGGSVWGGGSVGEGVGECVWEEGVCGEE